MECSFKKGFVIEMNNKYFAMHRKVLLFWVMLFLLSGCGKRTDYEETKYIDFYEEYIIGKVENVIKEESNIPDLRVRYKTIGYEIKVLVSLSEDFCDGDELSVYLDYYRSSPVDGPKELDTGDIIVVSYFPDRLKSEDGKKIIDSGTIAYGTVDNLSGFVKRSPEKVQKIIDDLTKNNEINESID